MEKKTAVPRWPQAGARSCRRKKETIGHSPLRSADRTGFFSKPQHPQWTNSPSCSFSPKFPKRFTAQAAETTFSGPSQACWAQNVWSPLWEGGRPPWFNPSESQGGNRAPAPESSLAVAGPKLSDTAGASSLQTIPYFNRASPPKLII